MKSIRTRSNKEGLSTMGEGQVTHGYRWHSCARWTDFDALGHVNAAKYMTFLEEGRDAWLRHLIGKGGESYVLASISLDYIQALEMEDRELDVEIIPVSIGRKSIHLRERVLNTKDQLLVQAATVIVMWDHDSNPSTSRVITQAERELLDGSGAQADPAVEPPRLSSAGDNRAY